MTALSSLWAGDAIRAVAASGSDIQRLALALGPVRSVVRVIDDHVPPMPVDWATIGEDDQGRPRSTSYTTFGDNPRMAINPLPVMQDDYDAARAIDIVTGFGMHEASHGKHSRDRYKDLLDNKGGREVPAFRPLRIAQYLWNLVEDPRIEQATSKDWPGFEPYFDAVLGWMWDDMTARSIMPRKYGPEVADKLRLVFLACRFPERAKFVWTKDKHMAREAEWWQAWQADYHDGRTTVRETIQRGLDHLAEDKKAAKELDQMAEEEARSEVAGERIRAQLDRLLKEGVAGAFSVCVSEHGDVRPLTEAEADEVNKLVREQLVVEAPILTGDGANCAAVRITKPEEDSASRRAYVGRPGATVEAMRSALVFRPELPQHDIKLKKSGDLDDEELYRWYMGDQRIFSERVIEERPDVGLGLLVDLSGSMSGRKLQIAQRLAQVFVWSVQDMPGVETHVWGHTGDGYAGDGADIFRLYEPGDPLSRLGLIDTIDHANNYDSFAVAYCVNKMRDWQQPQKVLIVLSDGLPSGHGYGHVAGRKHVRRVCDWARTQGVEVLQIAIDPSSIRPAEQEEMFGPGNWIGYTSDADLPRQLTKVLARWA